MQTNNLYLTQTSANLLMQSMQNYCFGECDIISQSLERVQACLNQRAKQNNNSGLFRYTNNFGELLSFEDSENFTTGNDSKTQSEKHLSNKSNEASTLSKACSNVNEESSNRDKSNKPSAFCTKEAHSPSWKENSEWVFSQTKPASIEEDSKDFETIESPKSSPTKPREKISNYSVRKDVISKTIFRSIRKFYVRDFKSFYNFSKWNKSENTESSGELIQKLNEYIAFKFPECDVEEMSLLLIWIIDAKEKFCTISHKHQERKTKVRDLLCSYNKRKLQSLNQYSEFLSLVIHFIDQPDIITKIVKGRNNWKLIKEYQRQMRMIKTNCLQAMSAL